MSTERLQKILAQAGVASRRAAEGLIREGRVRVNGRIVRQLGTQADPIADRIELDGRRVVAEKPVYFLLNKPREVVTTLEDPEGRETVANLMRRVPERVFPVGRLDYHTSGALLLTNDGEMAQALLHPRRGVPKTYVVKVRGLLPIKVLEVLRNGVEIGPREVTGPAELFVIREERGNTWLQLTITEGKNRQIHRMVEAVGYRVQRLSRIVFAGLTIEGLPPGAFRPLASDELRKLKRDYRNPARTAGAASRRTRQAQAAYGAVLDLPPEAEVPPRPRRSRPRPSPSGQRPQPDANDGQRPPRRRQQSAPNADAPTPSPRRDRPPARWDTSSDWDAPPAKQHRAAPAEKRDAGSAEKRGAGPANKKRSDASAKKKRGAASAKKKHGPSPTKQHASPAKRKRAASQPGAKKRSGPQKAKKAAASPPAKQDRPAPIKLKRKPPHRRRKRHG